MRMIFVLLAVVALLGDARAAANSDSRKLTAAEQKTFFPLVCGKPIAGKSGNNCTELLGRTDGMGGEPVSITLGAIAYGAFTRADQAYVTYDGDFEPHADNFGGGILFERAKGTWRLARWYPGGQMEQCLALPGAGVQRMLCLTGYSGMGEVDSSVWIDRVPDSDADGAFAKASVAVLKAQDDRQSDNENYACTLRHGKDEAVLLSIDDLKRSAALGFFAESNITYATAAAANAACAKKQFGAVSETVGVVRYRLDGGKVTAVTPAKFSATDY